jgi:hypothetical protein
MAIQRWKARADRASLNGIPAEYKAEYADEEAVRHGIDETLEPEEDKNGYATAVGDCFYTRCLAEGGCDTLVALTVLDKNNMYVTVGWRILKRFKLSGYQLELQKHFYDAQTAKANSLLIDEQEEVAAEVIRSLCARIVKDRQGGKPDDTTAVLLGRGELEGHFTNTRMKWPRGDYHYFSFVRRNHDYNGVPNIECSWRGPGNGFTLSSGSFVAWPTDRDQGDAAAFRVLKDVKFADVAEKDFPKELIGERKGLEGLNAVRDAGKSKDYRWSDPVTVGTVYAARCLVHPGTEQDNKIMHERLELADVLVVFTVTAVDKHAVTISWRVIRDYIKEPVVAPETPKDK